MVRYKVIYLKSKNVLKSILRGYKMKRNKNLDELYNDIPVGKENAISREQLACKWGCDLRRVRGLIAKMRNTDNGDCYIIVSSSTKQKGYYKTDNIDDIKEFEKEVLNRGKHTFYPLRKVRLVYERLEKRVAQ